MFELERILLKHFGPTLKSRGIIFSKTRQSTLYLKDWIRANTALQEAGIKADILTGAGNSISHMTLNMQEDTIRSFRLGKLNLLISTSVAEEGLDIPDCNLVIRYGLLTNEIAQQQASGRARAKNSQYSVVADEGGREVRREKTNEYLEELTGQAVGRVQQMSPEDFRTKITKLQKQAVDSRKAQEIQQMRRRSLHTAASVQLLCRKCFTPVASGSDIRVIEDTHHVNVNADFKKHYKLGGQVPLDRTFEDWEPGRKIHCSYGGCNQDWGFEILYKKCLTLPNIAIKHFALETPNGRVTKKKWKDITFTVEKFDFSEYCLGNCPDIFD